MNAMRRILAVSALILCLLLTSSCGKAPATAKGPYLGESLPGTTAKLFAPSSMGQLTGTVSLMFSPDATEVYWATHRETGSIELHCLKQAADGAWAPKPMPSFFRNGDNGPTFAADGNRLYYLRLESDRLKMYYSDKTGETWSPPTAMPDAINSLKPTTTLSVSSAGDLYFSSEGDIYLARQEQGQYTAVSKLESPINSDAREVNPYIARDGSYLLFARMQGNFYSLMASFKNADESWGAPVSLGNGYAPWVTDDGKYLFYANMKANSIEPYWVDARVIEAARPK